MKTYPVTFALITLLTGCATTTTTNTQPTPESQAQKIERVTTIAKLAAYTGTAVWLKDHPEDRPTFESVRVGLKILAGKDQVTPQEFASLINRLPVKELKGENGAIIVGAAMIVYDGYLKEHVNLDSNVYVRPVIVAVLDGMGSALYP